MTHQGGEPDPEDGNVNDCALHEVLRRDTKDIPGYPLAIYLAGFRLGTQFDLGPLNFDFNYTIGMNSLTKTDFRTNTHVFKFSLGWLF